MSASAVFPEQVLLLQKENAELRGENGLLQAKVTELQAKLAEHNPIERVGLLAKAKVPALFIHGDDDKVVPLKENSALASRIEASSRVPPAVGLKVTSR